MSRDGVDRMAMYTALFVYLAVWTAIFMRVLGEPGLTIGLIVGGAYVLGHWMAIFSNGHCYLSADPQALPMALLASIGTMVFLWFTGMVPDPIAPLKFFNAFAFSFGAGHVAAILYSILFNGLVPVLGKIVPVGTMSSAMRRRGSGFKELSEAERKAKEKED
ncbi:MAG: hypothetical protein OEZ54_04875 [Gemmatimonadota bacterium]|nr:hypothetical protein [Gemmatimonadota bacterium]